MNSFSAERLVIVDSSDRVMTITINRPEEKNALSHAMYNAISDALRRADNDDQIRCVILTGTGDAFTAGNDLEDFKKPAPEGPSPVGRFLQTVSSTETPIIAAVNGIAVGIGLTMLLHTDLAFAAETASFSGPFTRVGLVPEAASSLLVPRSLGNAWANDILLSGRVLSAKEALTAGLVSRVVPDNRLLEEAKGVAAQIAGFAPTSIRETKKLIRLNKEEVKTRMSDEAQVFYKQLRSEEFTESVRALQEGRAPMFD